MKKTGFKMYVIMLIITGGIFISPILLKIPYIYSFASWAFSSLIYGELKSAYLGIIGGIAGSWLAITGAIYTQKKFDEENRKRENDEKKVEIRAKEGITIIMCKELLWNEVIANHHSLYGESGRFLEAVIKKQDNYYFDGRGKFRLDNWNSIRVRVITDNLFCAIKVMKLYKYYEFLAKFEGTALEAADLSQIDFNQYMSTYIEIRKYLGIGEE